MPLPTPKKGEKQNAFVSRCISFLDDENSSLSQDQRVAACFTKWRDSKQMGSINLSYQVPIIEQGFVNGDFIIQGTAITSVITSNNHKFLSEELEKSAGTLKGVPLLKDHDNTIGSIMGRVLSGTFNEIEDKVDFRAKVIDKQAQELIKDGRLNTVSIGADVKEIDEEDGFFIPRGIIFRELSLVAVPADEGATFQIALKEAYNKGIPKEDKIQLNKQEVIKMSEEETETSEEKEEATPEPKESEPEPVVTEEKVKSLVKQILKESDEDEKPEPEPEPEPKEPEAEPVEEPKEEEPKEEEEEESEEAEENQIVRSSLNSFTLVREKY